MEKVLINAINLKKKVTNVILWPLFIRFYCKKNVMKKKKSFIFLHLLLPKLCLIKAKLKFNPIECPDKIQTMYKD